MLRLKIAAVALGICIGAAAAPIDAAKKLYLDGQYEEALSSLQTLHKKSPRDGNTAYYLGATLYALERGKEAVAPLTVAEGRGVADASRLLAQIALDDYRPAEASAHIDKWEAAIRKNRKAAIPDALGEMQDRAMAMRNMMERVERIEIVDSLTVDAYEFFRHYRLSEGAGQLLSGDQAGVNDAEMVFQPQCGRELFWSAASDSAAAPVLMMADILDDGTVENPAEISLGFDADATAYPFLMPDGVTLYFAAKGPESLGGYDIFMTRRTDDGSFLQPQNVGMPYNSPANDYLLAIDEETGMGWWATDRSAPEGKVTIYEFIPSAMRVNVAPDAPDLASRAKADCIATTLEPGKDYDALRSRVAALARESDSTHDSGGPSFAIAMSDGSVLHSLSDFRTSDGRRAMENLLAIDEEIAAIEADLATLREKYSAGARNVATRIKGLENELDKARKRRAAAANKTVRLESRAR